MSDVPIAKKPKLSGEDFIKLKETLRQRKKKLLSIPRLNLLGAGESASLTVNSDEDRIPIFLKDVQNLLLYSVIGHHSPSLPDRWCKLEKYNKITHTVLFIVEGLSLNHYINNKSKFQYLNSKLEYKLELITPAVYGGSVVEELVAVPLGSTQKSRLIKQFGSLESAIKENKEDLIRIFKFIFPMQSAINVSNINEESIKLPSTDRFSRTHLILSPWQLVEENYPIPLKGGLAKKYENYVFTKDKYAEVHSKSQMYGLDCEMCKTTTGLLELTRISIVDETLNTVYDTLVKPDNTITDYLTCYSGITQKMLEHVTTKLSDVQKFIRAFLPRDAILVGQSLNSDLHALQMMHPYIIDTSVIFNLTGDRFRKSKLKVLAEAFLNEQIQMRTAGHCSTEDSQASMKLVKLKLANSLHFGDSVLIDQSYIDSYAANRKQNKRIPMKQEEVSTLGHIIFNCISQSDPKTAAIFGSPEILNDYSKILINTKLKIMEDKEFEAGDSVRLVIKKTAKEAITRFSEVAMEHHLNFCHIKLDNDQLSEENVDKTLNSVDKWFKKIWKHTALHGLVCVIFTGEENSTNGALFLNIKKNIDVEVKQEL